MHNLERVRSIKKYRKVLKSIDSIEDSTPYITHDRSPNITPDSTHDSTSDSTADSTPDRTPDSTPNITPDITLNSTQWLSH